MQFLLFCNKLSTCFGIDVKIMNVRKRSLVFICTKHKRELSWGSNKRRTGILQTLFNKNLVHETPEFILQTTSLVNVKNVSLSLSFYFNSFATDSHRSA